MFIPGFSWYSNSTKWIIVNPNITNAYFGIWPLKREKNPGAFVWTTLTIPIQIDLPIATCYPETSWNVVDWWHKNLPISLTHDLVPLEIFVHKKMSQGWVISLFSFTIFIPLGTIDPIVYIRDNVNCHVNMCGLNSGYDVTCENLWQSTFIQAYCLTLGNYKQPPSSTV